MSYFITGLPDCSILKKIRALITFFVMNPRFMPVKIRNVHIFTEIGIKNSSAFTIMKIFPTRK
jgi:hypothetical protein